MDRRKLLAIVGLIAVVALLGVALYFAFFRPAPAPLPPTPGVNLVPINAIPLPPITNIAPPTGVLPYGVTPPGVNAPVTAPVAISATAQGGITRSPAITDTPAQFVHLANDGRPNFYDPTSQQFYRIGADGRPVALSDQRFPNVRSVAWAPRQNRAILEFPDGANVSYDFDTKKQVSLPAHWEQFSFSPSGNQIAGLNITLDRENRWLFAADFDGKNFQSLEALGNYAKRVTVSWSPNDQVVAFSRTGNDIGDERQQVLLIGKNGENFPGLVVEGIDFRPNWSPSGARILYSATRSSNDFKPELWIVDGSGNTMGANRQRLQVNTWADKCTFAAETAVYCAVPTGLERGYGLTPALADTVPDTIERIDLSTGARTTVARPESDASIHDLSAAPDGSRLYFTTRQDGKLHEMRLR